MNFRLTWMSKDTYFGENFVRSMRFDELLLSETGRRLRLCNITLRNSVWAHCSTVQNNCNRRPHHHLNSNLFNINDSSSKYAHLHTEHPVLSTFDRLYLYIGVYLQLERMAHTVPSTYTFRDTLTRTDQSMRDNSEYIVNSDTTRAVWAFEKLE